jgi:hypothetical protein
LNITSLGIGFEDRGSNVGVENRCDDSFVTQPVAAGADWWNVTTEEGVWNHDPEQSISGSRSGGAGEDRTPSVGDLDTGASNGATIIVVGAGELHVLVEGAHPSGELLVGSEDGGVELPEIRSVGGRVGDGGHVVVMSVIDVETAPDGKHQIVDGLGYHDVTVQPHKVRSPLVEALLVHILNSLEDESFDHAGIICLVNREYVDTELFHLCVDGIREGFDLIWVDSDSLGHVERPGTEEVECETLGKGGPRRQTSRVGEFVATSILSGASHYLGLVRSVIGLVADDRGVLLDLVSHSSRA